MINKTPHIDNGFSLLKEDFAISSPISTIYYEKYNNINDLTKIVNQNIKNIQCIVTNCKQFNNKIKFGQAQKPELWDYSDNVDTLKFLMQQK